MELEVPAEEFHSNQEVHRAIFDVLNELADFDRGGSSLQFDTIEQVRADAEVELGRPVTAEDVERVLKFLKRKFSTRIELVIQMRRFFFGYLPDEKPVIKN